MEPLGTGVAKVGEAASQEATHLLRRVLGPSADEIGTALARWTATRVGNVERIARKAESKSVPGGAVPMRVAHRILEDGSWSDDELMAEYLSGVLAGSRGDHSWDDRGVAIAAMVNDMSVLQLRAHFILYREWADRLAGHPDLELGLNAGMACMYVDLEDFANCLIPVRSDESDDVQIVHALVGLVGLELVSPTEYGIGKPATLGRQGLPFEQALMATPSMAGVELWGWACGLPLLTGSEFVQEAPWINAPQIARPENVALPNLPRTQEIGRDPA